MLESGADRLAMIQAVGEQFSTGRSEVLWGIFDRPSFDADTGELVPVKNRRPQIECRDDDLELHELVKGSKVTRLSDGKDFFVKEFEPDGTGMTIVMLSQ